MKALSGRDAEPFLPFFRAAAEEAKQALCHQAKCGTVIVQRNIIIGSGYNAPPLDRTSNQRCDWQPDPTRKPKYDVTCCVHAEWRAILDASRNDPSGIVGSTLYFIRVDSEGNFTGAGVPYCTVCSRLAMESGIGQFCLWNETDSSIEIYDAAEYDLASAAYYLS